MPELPEVETVVRQLDARLQNHSAENIRFFRKDIRTPIPVAKVQSILLDNPVLRVVRRSKYIMMQTNVGTVIFHLGMSGKMFFSENSEAVLAHTHAIFSFRNQDGTFQYLHFSDPRRFGVIEAIEGANWNEHPLLAKIGVEPLTHPDLGNYFATLASKRQVNIKSFIMDQRIVAGVGNIYASEALFAAGIHPLRPVKKVKLDQFQDLARAIQKILQSAIDSGGTTFRDYRNAEHKSGAFALKLQVYAREDERCYRCKGVIRSVVIQGRSTFYCKSCQKR